MRQIPLIAKFTGHFALVDDEDFEWLSKFRWSGNKRLATIYAHVSTRKKGFHGEQMHRLILGLSKRNGIEIDHIDGDGLNNQKSNLRGCNHSQNAIHRNCQRNSTTGFKGVSWFKSSRKYQATITVNGVWVRLGFFTDPIQAARAYDQAALKYFGEFAALNFPTG